MTNAASAPPMRTPAAGTPRLPFVRRVAALFSGTVVAQGVQLAALPLLSRAYGPQHYGAYGTFAGALFVAGMVATLRYDLAIQLPRSNRLANDLARACMWMSACTAAVVLLVGLAATGSVSSVSLPRGFAVYLAVSALLVGFFNTASAVAIRRHGYRAISVARVTQVVVSVGTSIACARARLLEHGLLIGNVAGYALGFVVLGVLARAPRARKGRSRTIRLLAAVRRYRSFALFNLPQALLDGVRPLGVVATVQYAFGAAATGMYHVANQALQTPSIAISQAIGQVYYRELVDNVGTSRGQRMSRRLTGVLVTLAAVGIVAVWQIGDPALTAVLGARWAGVHGPMMSLSFLGATNLVVSPLVFVFHVRKRHREFLLWGVAYNGVAIGALVLAARVGASLNSALLGYALCSSAVLLVIGARSLVMASTKEGGSLSP